MKFALVTGGTRGIGREICLKLVEMGYYVLVNFVSNVKEANVTLDLILKSGGQGELLKFDVSNEADVAKVLGGWMENNKDKCIEVLINNAGIKKDTLMMWMKPEEWKSVIDTNLSGFFYVTSQVLNGMLLQKYGRIVNITSLSGLRGMAGQTNYSAAKAGLIGATKALAQEVGRRGITVNAIAPGFIKTDMIDGIEEKDFKALIPMARFGMPEEVAEVVAFIASPKASYITGEVISVNGGLYT